MHILILTNIQHTYSVSTAVIGDYLSYVRFTGGGTYLSYHTIRCPSVSSMVTNKSYPALLCIDSGAVFELYFASFGDASANVIIEGYLIKKSEINFSVPPIA